VGIDWEEIQHFGTHKLKQQQQQRVARQAKPSQAKASYFAL
jgi:hypothetical protein